MNQRINVIVMPGHYCTKIEVLFSSGQKTIVKPHQIVGPGVFPQSSNLLPLVDPM